MCLLDDTNDVEIKGKGMMSDLKKQQSAQIHILRAMGILLLILAHVNPPKVLFELRNFDVILMVVLSSVSYIAFYKEETYGKYLIKRFKRLVIPTWIFILISALVYFLVALLTRTNTILPVKTLLVALCTFSGVGYLWIMRVYCYNAVWQITELIFLIVIIGLGFVNISLFC